MDKCPECKSDAQVFILDGGLKRIVRFLFSNNRLACMECRITWRRKWPECALDLQHKSEQAQRA